MSDSDEDGVFRTLVLELLKGQGFGVDALRNEITPAEDTKEAIRRLHSTARDTLIERMRPKLQPHEKWLLGYFASGEEIEPHLMEPELIEVNSGTEYDLLFKYASLYWSVPVSAGYGRRLRFLVMDKSNGKLIGLIGLDDPVYSLKVRDQWIGWTPQAKAQRLKYVMNAFVLGAVPPYNQLLCGKLVAMLVASNEVREAFRQKYKGKKSLISGQEHDGNLAMITTMSALGRSSIYNRLKFHSRPLFIKAGLTSGSGDFQFINGLYHQIAGLARAQSAPSAKNIKWGTGWRNRREIITKSLKRLNLSPRLLYHGIGREVYVVPLASNAREFLRGECNELDYYDTPISELFAFFRQRWLLARGDKNQEFRTFDREELGLWTKN